jgi:dihydrofolate reductase
VRLCDNDSENFVMGGASIYRQFMEIAGKLYITRVHKDFDADCFFPQIDTATWKLIESEDIPYDEQCCLSYTYEIWERNP